MQEYNNQKLVQAQHVIDTPYILFNLIFSLQQQQQMRNTSSNANY